MHLAFGIATNLLIGIGLLYVLVWFLIFGGVGAILSSSRDGSPLSGIGWGVLIGPVGWAVICARTRRHTPHRAAQQHTPTQAASIVAPVQSRDQPDVDSVIEEL
jgi:TRAP-type C4-dicarboxylate transport system permease small subunit